MAIKTMSGNARIRRIVATTTLNMRRPPSAGTSQTRSTKSCPAVSLAGVAEAESDRDSGTAVITQDRLRLQNANQEIRESNGRVERPNPPLNAVSTVLIVRVVAALRYHHELVAAVEVQLVDGLPFLNRSLDFPFGNDVFPVSANDRLLQFRLSNGSAGLHD